MYLYTTFEQERIQWQKNAEINTNTQIAMTQEHISRKDKQIDELNSICKQLKENVSVLENQIRLVLNMNVLFFILGT